MTLTQVQSLALATFFALILVVLGGSLIEWAKWIALYLIGVRPVRSVKSPQATVGLFDILVSVLVLIMFFLMASVLWRSLGLPSAGRPQQIAQASNTAAQSDVEKANSEELEDKTGYNEQTNKDSPNTESTLGESKDSEETVLSSEAAPPKPAVFSQVQFIYSGYAMSAQLLCVIFMTFFITGRTNCSLKKLGWRTDQLASDVRAGFRCFLMLTPLILVMNAILQNVTKTPYEHPVQVMIREFPWLLGVAFWQAAICAPISEEFAFRALLIGWFESIHFGRNKFKAFMLGDSGVLDPLPNESLQESSVAVSADTSNPYIVSTSVEKANDQNGVHLSADAATEVHAPWWPVLVSGTLFGLAHYNYGVSWFPLIIFGVVLGRLYQIRQSLIPGIVVHMLFNAMNVALLGLSLLAPKLAG